MGSALAAEPERASLPWLGGSCRDGRYPQLAGEWAVGCYGGKVSRAFHVETGQQVELERSVEAPAVADGLLVGPTGRWELPAAEPTDQREKLEAVAPWATDGRRTVVPTADAIVLLEEGRRIDAAPLPWRQPAVGEGFVAWIEAGDAVMVWREDTGRTVHFAEGRHVAAEGRWIAWIEEERVCLQTLHTMPSCTWSDAHTSVGLSLDEGVACWEQWNGEDVDVQCSDGFSVGGPGHQRGPSRDEGRLLYRDGDTVRLTVLPTDPE